MNRIKKETIIISAVIILIAAIFYFFNIGCVWKSLFNIECPTCGMTRAWDAVLHGDIKSAFTYHPLFFTIPFLWLYVLFDGRLFKNKSINMLILMGICISFIAIYISRLTN